MIALVASTWLMVAGILGMRHEAEVAHAIDASGMAVHGERVVGHHAGGAADLHAAATSREGADVCWLSYALHQPGASHGGPDLDIAAHAHVVVRTLVAAPIAIAAEPLFRLAPKTSPPVA